MKKYSIFFFLLLLSCQGFIKQNNDIVVPETIIDERDGQSYRIRPFGKLWWMIDNLNYDIGDSLYSKETYIGMSAYCLNNDSENCAKYGRLYDLPAAMMSCPNGWRLPSLKEWLTLAKNHSNCTPNRLGANYRDSIPAFEPLAGGDASVSTWNKGKVSFFDKRKEAIYWCAENGRKALTFNINMEFCEVSIVHIGATNKAIAQKRFYSCRCVKDPLE